MAEIIDLLFVPDDQAMTFVVDTAVSFVVATNVFPVNGFMDVGAGDLKFQQGDNLKILSFGINIPYGFELYHTQVTQLDPKLVWWLWNATTQVSFPLRPPELWFPFLNYEMSYGRFVESTLLLNDFKLRAQPNPITISMLNIPAALNGETIYIKPWAKVAHTLELVL